MKRLAIVSPLVALVSFLPVVTLLLASCAPSSYMGHDHEFVWHRDVFALPDREPPGGPVIYPGPEPSPDGRQPTGPVLEPPASPQEPPAEPPAPEPARCWPGHGWGDKNHAHCGPPGRRGR